MSSFSTNAMHTLHGPVLDTVDVPIVISRPNGLLVFLNRAAKAAFAAAESPDSIWQLVATSHDQEKLKQAYLAYGSKQFPMAVAVNAWMFSFAEYAQEDQETAVITTCVKLQNALDPPNPTSLENIASFLLILDSRGNIANINRQAARALGYQRNELIGKNWFTTCLPPAVQTEIKHIYQQAIDTGSDHFYHENAVLLKDGNERYFGWHHTILYQQDGKTVAGVLCMAKHLTLGNTPQKSIFQYDDQYRRLVHNSLDIVYVFSNIRGALFWSENIRDILGYDPKTLVQNPFIWPDAIHPDDKDLVHAAITNTEATRGYDLVYRIRDSKGRWRWLHDRFIDKYIIDNEIIIEGMATDITKEKELERIQQAKSARYQQMFENNWAIKLLINPRNGRILEANPAALSFYGYDLETLTQMSIQDLNTLPSTEVQQEMKWAQQQQKRAFNFSHRLADGTIRQVLVHSSPIIIDNTTYLYSIIHDVTSIKQAEDNLRQSERRYRNLFKEMPVGLYQITSAGVIVEANPALIAMLKYPDRESLLGTNVAQLFVNRSDLNHVEKVLAEKQPARGFELQMYRYNGSTVWMRAKAQPIYSDAGEISHYRGYLVDISERKGLEAQLRASEMNLRAVLDATAVSYIFINPDYQIILTNKFARKQGRLLFGEEPAEGMDIRHFIREQDTAPFLADFQKSLEGNIVKTQHQFNTSEGTTCWFESSYYPVVAQNGHIRGVCLTTTDITERHFAKEQAVTLTLERERVKLLANFVQNASHEFRTPLSIIEMSNFIISRSTDDIKKQQKTVTINQQIQRMTVLIDSLLLMAQLDSTNTIETDDVDLNHLIYELLLSHKQQIEGKDINLKRQLSLPLPIIPANRRLLKKALASLLHNAIRYTPANETITLSAAVSDATVTINLIDTGSGIQPSDMPRIYERFFRADKPHTTSGFGLGLPIAKRVIELHQGTLSIASEPDRGTAVTITLPLTTTT